jgi:hypothetical protein
MARFHRVKAVRQGPGEGLGLLVPQPGELQAALLAELFDYFAAGVFEGVEVGGGNGTWPENAQPFGRVARQAS